MWVPRLPTPVTLRINSLGLLQECVRKELSGVVKNQSVFVSEIHSSVIKEKPCANSLMHSIILC